MLKRFFLNSLSAFVGAWSAIVLLFVGLMIFLFGVIGSMTSMNGEELRPHSVMRIALAGEIIETENTNFDYTILFTGEIENTQTLKDILTALEIAKNSKFVEAVMIECQGVSAAPATLDAIRNGVKDFKKCGKRVFAYGDFMTMGDYYVACCADEVYLNPAGSLDLQGLSGTSIYMKDLLDTLGIQVEAVRVGSYKSAIEPYTSNEMSSAAKEQLDTLYTDMWDYILKGIADDRKISPNTVNKLVNDFIFLDQTSVAKENKLVDDCLYYREVEKIVSDYVGQTKEDLNFISPTTLIGKMPVNYDADNQIAVLYLSGEIGEIVGAGINCHEIVPIITALAENDHVKGMVLRVNSPGGSVFGSEQIGEALDYFKSKGKPLAVSMGDYAASGGYWISAGADKIYANPLTVTGSIGIFGLVPNIGRLADKIGLHPQTVSTNPGVNFPSIFYPMSEEQKAALQNNIDRGYDKFISRVADGRHKSKDYIESIAEGRVWSGIQAKKLGLVDELGNLEDAISWVAEKGSVSNANIIAYPMPEYNIWTLLAQSSMAQSPEIKLVTERLTSQSIDQKAISFIERFLMQSHVLARCPYYKLSL